MSEAPRSLSRLQAWMQQAITHPRSVLAASDPQAIEEQIAASPGQESAARLAIYQQAYFARLLEVMREIFPALVQAIDRETFDALALAYLHEHPPTSYTLNRLPDRFIAFLTATRPARASDTPDWADFVISLARLEKAVDDVFDGPGIEGDPPADEALLRALAESTSSSATLTVKLAPCVRLLEFPFPINDYYSAYRLGEPPAMPPPDTTWLALHRQDYVVRRYPLSEAQYAVLTALANGEPLAYAVNDAVRHQPAETLPDLLRQWFHEWSAVGMIRVAMS